MVMKVKSNFFEEGAKNKEKTIIKYIQEKYKAEKTADFFNLDSSDESLKKFVQYLFDQDISDDDLIDRLTDQIILGELHPLQSIRLAQIINDPDEDLDGEDKEQLIDQVLKLEWPKQINN